eukprot:756483-Hanusia_phi.AAC.1
MERNRIEVPRLLRTGPGLSTMIIQGCKPGTMPVRDSEPRWSLRFRRFPEATHCQEVTAPAASPIWNVIGLTGSELTVTHGPGS